MGPILIPNRPICLLDLILSAIFFAPKLLKPSLLIKASSSTSRKTLGFGFPYCFKGVTVPTSTKPNPSLNNELYTSAFLSNPAAMPIGFSNFLSNNSVVNKLSSSFFFKMFGIRLNFNDFIAKLCAASGSNLKIKDLKFENII